MRKIATAILASALCFGAGGAAWAQKAPAAKPAAKPAPAAGGGATSSAPPRVRNYDFDADTIDGELVRPEGEFLAARRGAEHGSLIRVRLDFIREIVKSAEDL